MWKMDEKETKRVVTAGLLGLAVGDAVGVPVEFLDQKTVQNLHVTDYITDPVRIGRSYPAGSWSDDTAMTVAAMDAVVKDEGRIDYSHIMQNFLTWWSGRDMELDDGQVFAKYSSREFPFGLGCICGEAMDRFAEGIPATECGPTGFMANGNGSLMRIFPFSMYCIVHGLDTDRTAELIGTASAITHGHDISRMGCMIYTELLRGIVEGKTIKDAFRTAAAIDYSRWYGPEALEAYKRLTDPSGSFEDVSADAIKGSGYVRDSLEVAVYSLLHTDSYRDAILTAVNFGYDTDTNACIAGGPAAVFYGVETIPESWMRGLRRRGYLEKLAGLFAEALFERGA